MKSTLLLVGATAAIMFLAGLTVGRVTGPSAPSSPAPEAVATVVDWTCSMHPQIRQPRFGQCPICGMDLIPAATDEGDAALGDRELRLSPAAMKLAAVETQPVRRFSPTAEVRMVGKVAYDETRLTDITARIPGRLERLYVDYTGIGVREGDHLLSIYSPELLGAQEELLQAIRTADELHASDNSLLRGRAQTTVDSAREKLRLWGLTSDQVRAIEANQATSDQLTIYSPVGGIVIERHALPGAYVGEGTRIVTIADLSRVWVKLEAYESDLGRLRFGQEVEFSTEAYPGESFHGKVAFIDPALDPRTRTVAVRLNVANDDGRLKPGLFVRAVARVRILGDGRVLEPNLAGKWISPMHPEIVKDEPGPCDVCGMPLVRAESLGFVGTESAAADLPLVIPVSAALITGQRAVVYVSDSESRGVFEGRVVTLGPRAGDHYLVLDGLAEGELVVTRGNFKIDSAMQLLAKPSMMNSGANGASQAFRPDSPPETSSPGGSTPGPIKDAPISRERFEVSAEFLTRLDVLLDAYLKLQSSLASDDLESAREGALKARSSLRGMGMGSLKGSAQESWMRDAKTLRAALDRIQQATAIAEARIHFETVSDTLIVVVRSFGAPSAGPVYRVRCPMAFDNRGANWLQASEEIRNPYFGASMLKCGNVEETLEGAGQ